MLLETHPTTAKDLIENHSGMGDVFLLASVTEDGNAIRITIAPETPIAVWSGETRDQIYAETGAFLPTRKEIGNPDQMQLNRLSNDIDWSSVHTLATGPFLWIKTIDQDEPRIHLLQNTMTKPVNPGRFNTPSGLVSSRDPFSSFFNVLNSQPSIIVPTSSQILAYGFEMPEELAGTLSDEFRTSVLNARTSQDANIHAQLGLDHADKSIIRPVLPTHLLRSNGSKPVIVDMLGEEFTLNGAHCLVDGQVHSANVHFPIMAQLPHRLGSLALIDAQGAGKKSAPEYRNTGFFTLEEAKALDTIPAPTDYKNGLIKAPGM